MPIFAHLIIIGLCMITIIIICRAERRSLKDSKDDVDKENPL